LTPDDLPDPFGEGGMSLAGCGQCMVETMHLVLTKGTAQVRCAKCQSLQAEFPLSADTSGLVAGHVFAADTSMLTAAQGFSAPGERTTIEPPEEWKPYTGPAQHTWTVRCDGFHPPGPCPPGAPMQIRTPSGGAAWGDTPAGVPPEPLPTPAELRAGAEIGAQLAEAGRLPPLPRFSPDQCNVYLRDGPYSGVLTWVMGAPSADFAIAGVGRYVPTSQTREGRAVYRWDRGAAMEGDVVS
jgi:LSD1 subclass zinc finger protein